MSSRSGCQLEIRAMSGREHRDDNQGPAKYDMMKILEKLKTFLRKPIVSAIISHLKDYKMVYSIVAAVASITGLSYQSEAVSNAIASAAGMASTMLTSITG